MSNAHTRKTYCVDCGTYIDSDPREIFNALEATRSASSHRNEELADRISRDTTITKQQIDFAARMMLEQVSRLSDGDYEQSMMVHFPWIALIVQLRHVPHLFRFENSPCISKTTKH